MYAIVLLPVILLLMITMVLTGWSASKPDRGVILGTTLPYSCLQDDTVLNLQSRYRRSLLTLSGAFLLPAGLDDAGHHHSERHREACSDQAQLDDAARFFC